MTKSVHYKLDTKFKSIVISARFFIPFEKKNNTKLALLAQLMDDRTIKYPSKTEMLTQLDNLYGANIWSKTSGVGRFQQLEVRLSGVNERFVNELLLKKQISLLSEVIYRPLITENTLQEAKENLRDLLLRQDERPNRYALKRAFEIAGKDFPLAIHSNGSVDDIDSIDTNQMIDFHRDVIQKAMMELFCIGDINTFEAQKYINQYFQSHLSFETDNMVYNLPKASLETVIEELPIQQASLIKLYTSQVNVLSDNYHAYRIGNIILGQLPTSYLFQEVREKNSLAYSVNSNTIAFDGILYMTTQLAHKNISRANRLMDEQLEKVKKGHIGEKQLSGAKRMLKNLLLSSDDDEYSSLNYLVQSVITNRMHSIEQAIKLYEDVSVEDIVNAFKNVEERLIYQLKGRTND